MSYLKNLTSNDVIVTPFTVNKFFSGSSSTDFFSYFKGNNTSYPIAGGEEGTSSLQLTYNSIKQLYYSNYISGSNGRISQASTASFNPDGTITGPVYTTNYLNSLASPSNSLRHFPTSSSANIGVISIPSKNYGNYIVPNSFRANITATSITSGEYIDDGNGNIIVASSPTDCFGSIIYENGIIVFTNDREIGIGSTFTVNSIQYNSSLNIYETQYKCTIRANEYNYSLNPSLLKSGSINTYKDFVTGSDFSPYVTTVGLYNENQELLAVGKLAQPLPTSQTTDTTILINIDR